MISLVIYGIIAIALASAAGYAFLSFTSVSRQTTQLQENQVHLQTAAAALSASLLALNNDGTLYPPMGITGGAYTQLPASLGVIAATPWGQPYLYCPMAQAATSSLSGTTTSTVVSPSGTTYSVTLYSGPVTQGLNYVVANNQSGLITGSQTGYVGFIVSSIGPGQNPPNCSSITVTAASGTNQYGGVSVAGGTVVGVTAGFPFTQRVIASTDRTEIFVAPSVSTGNGTGQDINNPTTISNAITIWKSLQPRLTEIYLQAGGTFNLTDSLNAETVRSYAQGENSSLVIATGTTPTGNAAATLNNTAATVTLTTATTFDNVNVVPATGSTWTAFKPLTLRVASFGASTASTLGIYNTQLTVSDSTLNNLAITGSNSGIEFYNYVNTTTSDTGSIIGNGLRVSFDGSPTVAYTLDNTSNAGYPAFALQLGSLNVSSNVTLNAKASQAPGIILNGSNMSAVGTVNVYASNGTYQSIPYGAPIAGYGYVDNGAGVEDLDGSSVSIPLGGTLSVTKSSGVLENGIYVRNAHLAVNGTLTASNVATGIIGAEPASSISGDANGRISLQSSGQACLTISGLAILGASTNYYNHIYPLYRQSQATGYPYAGIPTFGAVQAGMPPMLTDTIYGAYATSNINTAAAAALTFVPPTGTGGTDPYVTITPGVAATVGGGGTAYLPIDKPSFEGGVRQLVNAEFMNGITLAFHGLCQ